MILIFYCSCQIDFSNAFGRFIYSWISIHFYICFYYNLFSYLLIKTSSICHLFQQFYDQSNFLITNLIFFIFAFKLSIQMSLECHQINLNLHQNNNLCWNLLPILLLHHSHLMTHIFFSLCFIFFISYNLCCQIYFYFSFFCCYYFLSRYLSLF